VREQKAEPRRFRLRLLRSTSSRSTLRRLRRTSTGFRGSLIPLSVISTAPRPRRSLPLFPPLPHLRIDFSPHHHLGAPHWNVQYPQELLNSTSFARPRSSSRYRDEARSTRREQACLGRGRRQRTTDEAKKKVEGCGEHAGGVVSSSGRRARLRFNFSSH